MSQKELRRFSWLDQLIGQAQDLLSAQHKSGTMRTYPAENIADDTLSSTDKKYSASLMRVNHSGEVCAQALYAGQLLTAKLGSTRDMLEQSRIEEVDHLNWCQYRLQELQSHTSYLNPIWYTQSFALGVITGLFGDDYSLGFVEETEVQVHQHLQNHLNNISKNDLRSRAIIEQMQQDEAHHGQSAHNAGAKPLPKPIQSIMKLMSKVMTFTSHHI